MENERNLRHSLTVEAAHRMMTAARTAPKAKGVDLLEIVLLERKEDVEQLSRAMIAKAETCGMKFLLRDAANILQGEAVLLIGSHRQPMCLNCSFCGAEGCETLAAGAPCAINSIDLGIALGSACAMAADMRVDTRVMFSAGWCALDVPGLLPECTQAIAIAIAASAKNPFFDRK